jgi:transglutaminase-like putative cysteine protease
MTFNTYFKVSSYGMVACGALTLAASGGIGLELTLAFAGLLFIAWNLEGSRWQLTERIGLIVVLLSLPLFYLDWKYQMAGGQARERVGVNALAHLILFLSAVKLLQVKADRDWVFLYLISFFEVLLAAGLSLSPLYLAMLGLYTLAALCTIVAFEIRKAGRRVTATDTRLLVPPDSTLIRRMIKRRAQRPFGISRRLPLVATGLLLLIFGLALPLFFIVPRYGNGAFARSNAGIGGVVGFAETVDLGTIGRLKESNDLVMRVRVEGAGSQPRDLRWRGVALDRFDGSSWRRSRIPKSTIYPANDRGLFQTDTTDELNRLVAQTFFVEAIDTPVLFAAPRVVAIQAGFPFIQRDAEGSLTAAPHDDGRIAYRVYSDTSEPEPETLRTDAEPYSAAAARYLQLPENLDPRIGKLAREVVANANAVNRYDQARAIEHHLQNDYGYTLDLKVSPSNPLPDFLFNVREGHCEYFATSMAVMLRTQGIASRVVNGFQTGVYNDAADAYTVTKRDAHSWVEVYFPESDAWVTFDPTPVAGRSTGENAGGLSGSLSKYAEALELLWIQYVISYDKQEQRSLATSVRSKLSDYRQAIGEELTAMQTSAKQWLRATIGGDLNSPASLLRAGALLLASVLGLFLFAQFVRRLYRLGFWHGLRFWQREGKPSSAVEFYERMTRALAARGHRRTADETPLEFATAVGEPEAIKITNIYNSVRFGEHALTAREIEEIEIWLGRMEGKHQ